ncbi:MAG: sulfite exporter TauE/SafE family protein [Bermanella sp.]
MDLYLLAFLTLLTSTFAAIMGQGGGLILMGILAGSVPANTLIAIHGVIQASSNGSRAYLAKKDINWTIILPVSAGIVLGAALMLPFIQLFNWQWMQGIIALYILWLTWGHFLPRPDFKALKIKNRHPFLKLGFLQGSLGMALGATGPLGNALLLKKGLGKEAIIASNAFIMLASHLVKIVFFSLLGVQLITHAKLIITLSLAAIAGSYIGSFFRHSLPEKIFFPLFKILLTLLALRMLVLAIA